MIRDQTVMAVLMSHELEMPSISAARRPTVLVGEDQVLLRMDLAQFLQAQGFAVLQAARHVEAMRQLAADWPVDAVVTDVDLGPGPNGLTLVTWLRDRHPDVPLFVCSGRLLEAADSGLPAADVFFKPFDPRKLVARIKQALGSRA